MKDASQQLLGSEKEFAEFIAQFGTEAFRADLVRDYDLKRDDVDLNLDTYLAEMLHGYRFLKEHLPEGKLRILEVGAGLGLISIYLHRQGHDVVALEPAALAFGFFDATKKEIWKRLGKDTPRLVEKTAEKLNEEEDGLFDFSFSVNVMEHIADIETATAAIISVLKPDGLSVNSCPNYLVPYEPHYAIPMFPFGPAATRILFAGKIDPDPDTWNSLNFIDWFRVRRMAHSNDASVTFEPSLIYKSFKRLGEDPEFMKRHENGLVGRTYKLLNATGLLYLLKFLPPMLSTPMIFTYRPKG